MSRSDETLYRQWVMLSRIPRYPRKVTVPELKSMLVGEGYTVDTRTVQRDLHVNQRPILSTFSVKLLPG